MPPIPVSKALLDGIAEAEAEAVESNLHSSNGGDSDAYTYSATLNKKTTKSQSTTSVSGSSYCGDGAITMIRRNHNTTFHWKLNLRMYVFACLSVFCVTTMGYWNCYSYNKNSNSNCRSAYSSVEAFIHTKTTPLCFSSVTTGASFRRYSCSLLASSSDDSSQSDGTGTVRGSNEYQNVDPIEDEHKRRLTEVNSRSQSNPRIVLSHARILCSELFEAADGQLKCDVDNRLLSLACLEPLRTATGRDKFLPLALYVRDVMLTMFLRLTDGDSDFERHVLIGSPGVGKSILMFLAALRHAQVGKKPVVFLRRTNEEDISVFVMEQVENQPDSVDVYFSRSIRKLGTDLTTVYLDVVDNMFLLANPLIFVDGPNHRDMRNTLEGTPAFFCTSGGYRPLYDDEIDSVTIMILDGWREDDMVSALQLLLPHVSRDAAVSLYNVCGGCIRRALLNDEKKVTEWFDVLIGAVSEASIDLAVRSNSRRTASNSCDRLRTMFVDPANKHLAVQVVDSRYAMQKLGESVSHEAFSSAYAIAAAASLRSVSGGLFEEIMHRWFKTSLPLPITGVVRSTGSTADGVKQLTAANMYWIPSVPNFPNIDAAVVCDGILECIQYTISETHPFNCTTFWTGFVERVLSQVEFSSVRITFVVPAGTVFVGLPEDVIKEYSSPVDAAPGPALMSMKMSFCSGSVNPVSYDDLSQTARATLPFLAE
jgi:hypothetical protein